MTPQNPIGDDRGFYISRCQWLGWGIVRPEGLGEDWIEWGIFCGGGSGLVGLEFRVYKGCFVTSGCAIFFQRFKTLYKLCALQPF